MWRKGSDRAAYERLIGEYSGYIYSIVHHVAGHIATPEDIEDCAAEVLAALWAARARFDPSKGDCKHYVAAAARNKAITLRGQLTGQSFVPLDEDMLELSGGDPALALEESQLKALVNEAVNALEPPDPDIFVRRYYFGDSLKAIALALGLTERAVEGRLYRGRQQLKVWLEGRL